jgi:type IV secretion system protein VirB6
MGFFGEFDVWLTNLLARYITDNTAAMARVLEPAIVTLGVLYIVVWGYLHLMGKIEQPFIEGVKRLLTMALILGVSLQFWLYNEIIVDTFFSAPASLAAGVIGAPTSAGIVDEILFDGDDAASLLLAKGGFFDESFKL